MKGNEERKLFSQAIKAWGVDAQVAMMLEEMAELQKELLKLKRKGYYYTAESIQPLIEEVIDTQLMLDQIKYMFDISGDGIRQQKLNRLKELLQPVSHEGLPVREKKGV